jgi:hypothetical protein
MCPVRSVTYVSGRSLQTFGSSRVAAIAKAAKGNWRALKLLVDILQDIERRTEPPARGIFGVLG